jgi:hypothetical protein
MPSESGCAIAGYHKPRQHHPSRNNRFWLKLGIARCRPERRLPDVFANRRLTESFERRK